jgi:pimeloyl-ACP methyl ester carboxylesterase
MVANIDDAIRSLNRHIAILEAKLVFLIRSSLYSDGNHIHYDDNGYDDHISFLDIPYEVRRKMCSIEEEIAYATRRKRNFEILRQMSATRYLTPERYTSIKNNIIRYLEYGPTDSNKILILLHGLGGSAERWSHVIPTLLSTTKIKEEDYRIIIPDIIGFGYSDKPAVEYTMDFFINDFFIPFLDNLGISKATIIGSSFGGHLATEFAIRFRDRVEKLILVSPAGMMREPNPTIENYARAALEPRYRRVYDAFREMVYDTSVVTEAMVRDFINIMNLHRAGYAFTSTLYNLKYAPGLRNRLSNITAPSLIVWGENDRMIPLAENAPQFNGIPNTIMERLLGVINECGHLFAVERPNMLGKIITTCLRPLP